MEVLEYPRFMNLSLDEQKNLMRDYIHHLLDNHLSIQTMVHANDVSIDRYIYLGSLPYNLHALFFINTVYVWSGQRDTYGAPVLTSNYIHYDGKHLLTSIFRPKVKQSQADISLVAKVKRILKEKKVAY